MQELLVGKYGRLQSTTTRHIIAVYNKQLSRFLSRQLTGIERHVINMSRFSSQNDLIKYKKHLS